MQAAPLHERGHLEIFNLLFSFSLHFHQSCAGLNFAAKTLPGDESIRRAEPKLHTLEMLPAMKTSVPPPQPMIRLQTKVGLYSKG